MSEHITVDELMSLIKQYGQLELKSGSLIQLDRERAMQRHDTAVLLLEAIEAQAKRVYQRVEDLENVDNVEFSQPKTEPLMRFKLKLYDYHQARGVLSSDEPSEVTLRKLRGYEENEQ